MHIRALSRHLLSTALAVSLLPLAASAATPRDPAASLHVYNDIHARLDTRGDLILIPNVDGLVEKAMDAIRSIAAIAPVMPGEANTPAATLAKVSVFLKQNGFYAVKGIGMSVVPRADGINKIKTFVARDAEAARLPLWLALVGGAPSAMKVHAYLPKDTVLVRSGTADMRALWKLVRSGATEIGGSEASGGMDMGLAMFTAKVGVSPEVLIQSIVPEGFLSIQLSSSSTVTIPMEGTAGATIPAPSLLLVTAVKDSTIIDTVKKAFAQNLQTPLPEVRLGDATVYNIPFPVPAPFPMQLTLATHGNYLLIGTTSSAVTDALDAATKGGGLKTEAEFASAFPAATTNNGILFVSSRLGQAFKTVQDQMFAQMPAGGGETAMFTQVRSLMDQNLDTRTAFTFYNLRNGVQASGTSASGGQQLVGSMFIAPMGMMAAIAIPSFVKARSTAQQNSCINNLRMIDSAKEQWAMAENKADGDPVDEAGIAAYLRDGIPTCPQGGTYTLNPIGQEPTCSHPGHGLGKQ